MANSPLFNANREINLSINHILSIRQYLDRFLMYLYQSINERPIVWRQEALMVTGVWLYGGWRG